MNRFITGTIVVLGLALGCGEATTAQAQAKAKWTPGPPKQLRGVWYAKPRVQHLGHDTTEVTNNAIILIPKWLYVMYDYGTHDYGGNRLAYKKVGQAYRLRSYDSVEKTWAYTKLQRQGKTLKLQKYGTRKAGKAFKSHAGHTYQLQYKPKLSVSVLTRK